MKRKRKTAAETAAPPRDKLMTRALPTLWL